MNALGEFLSCDWGSSSFRLRWVRGEDEVVRELSAPAGVRSLYDEAARRGLRSEPERAPIFENYLRDRLEALLAPAPPVQPLPLFISGMASSSVGWRELPYARVPFPLDGSGVVTAPLGWNAPRWVAATTLVSGVATAADMMRGEETEIIGLISAPALAAHRENSVLILPGTHSKHVTIVNGAVVDWRTYMTGELFDVLSAHSLLRASVDLPARDFEAPDHRAAFEEGARLAREGGVSGALFRVRTRAVLGRRPPAENTWFLSGVLIGGELAALVNGAPRVLLAASEAFAAPYAAALKVILESSAQWDCIAPERVRCVIPRGHGLIARRSFGV